MFISVVYGKVRSWSISEHHEKMYIRIGTAELCYKRISWLEAERLCKENDMTLPSIMSNTQENYWIHLSRTFHQTTTHPSYYTAIFNRTWLKVFQKQESFVSDKGEYSFKTLKKSIERGEYNVFYEPVAIYIGLNLAVSSILSPSNISNVVVLLAGKV